MESKFRWYKVICHYGGGHMATSVWYEKLSEKVRIRKVVEARVNSYDWRNAIARWYKLPGRPKKLRVVRHSRTEYYPIVQEPKPCIRCGQDKRYHQGLCVDCHCAMWRRKHAKKQEA